MSLGLCLCLRGLVAPGIHQSTRRPTSTGCARACVCVCLCVCNLIFGFNVHANLARVTICLMVSFSFHVRRADGGNSNSLKRERSRRTYTGTARDDDGDEFKKEEGEEVFKATAIVGQRRRSSRQRLSIAQARSGVLCSFSSCV